MVKGLDIFRAHFQNFPNRYVLIGGTACDIAMTGAGLEFRATKDLDIVLVVEALDADFVRAFCGLPHKKWARDDASVKAVLELFGTFIA